MWSMSKVERGTPVSLERLWVKEIRGERDTLISSMREYAWKRDKVWDRVIDRMIQREHERVCRKELRIFVCVCVWIREIETMVLSRKDLID